jgi:sulfur-oxidizing protein SoxY
MNASRGGRRRTLGLIAGLALTVLAGKPRTIDAAEATEADALIRELTGSSPLRAGGMRLTIPELADTGFSVPVSVEVESAMTPADFVRSIHILAPRNPRTLAASITLSPLLARAAWNTRMRLSTSQEIVAVAMMSDGSHRVARASVVVTISACIDGT